jgi:DNA replicative helicase MCM subunit Mcm2 (Cdc46/Mcm family)
MQAAVDPSTGKIDVSILTTGISGAVRKQRADRAQQLLDLIQSKGKVLVLKYNKLFEEFREKLMEKGEQVTQFSTCFSLCRFQFCRVISDFSNDVM